MFVGGSDRLVDPSFRKVASPQRLHLRREGEVLTRKIGIIQGFFAKTVTRYKQRFLDRVPNRQRKHAVEVFHASSTPLAIGGENHLRVGAGMKPVSVAD